MDKPNLTNTIKDFFTNQKGLSILVFVLNFMAGLIWLWIVYGMILAPIHSVKEEIPRLTIDQKAYTAVQEYLSEIAPGYIASDFSSPYANPEPFNEYTR